MNFITGGAIVMILILNTVVVLIMSVLMRFIGGRKQLEKEGYTKEYIEKTQELTDKRGKIGGYGFFLLQGLGILICLISGIQITADIYMNYILIGTVIVGWIGAILINYFLGKKENTIYKDLAVSTGSDIAVDFKHTWLNTIINIKLELVCTVLMVYVNFTLLNHSLIVYFYASVIWITYINLKLMKNRVQAMIAHSYKMALVFVIAFHSLKILAVWGRLDMRYRGNFSALGMTNLVLLGILAAVIITSIILGLVAFPKLKKMFSSGSGDSPAVAV
ncbi:hypothetical protein ACFL6I_04110 [candidate division KSB1 bacterium]